MADRTSLIDRIEKIIQSDPNNRVMSETVEEIAALCSSEKTQIDRTQASEKVEDRARERWKGYRPTLAFHGGTLELNMDTGVLNMSLRDEEEETRIGSVSLPASEPPEIARWLNEWLGKRGTTASPSIDLDKTQASEKVEVTQADREAAAERLHGGISTYEASTADRIREGRYDGHPWVQAFARRRLATASPSSDPEPDVAEREAQLQALWDAHREYIGHAEAPLPKSRTDARKLYGLMLDRLAAIPDPEVMGEVKEALGNLISLARPHFSDETQMLALELAQAAHDKLVGGE